MDKIKKMQAEMRHKEWIEAYEAYQLSGKTVKEWCAENYISIKTFYYRLRQVRKKSYRTDRTARDCTDRCIS